MTQLTKKQKLIAEKLDSEKTYSVVEAMEILQSVKSEKFEESIESWNLELLRQRQRAINKENLIN